MSGDQSAARAAERIATARRDVAKRLLVNGAVFGLAPALLFGFGTGLWVAVPEWLIAPLWGAIQFTRRRDGDMAVASWATTLLVLVLVPVAIRAPRRELLGHFALLAYWFWSACLVAGLYW